MPEERSVAGHLWALVSPTVWVAILMWLGSAGFITALHEPSNADFMAALYYTSPVPLALLAMCLIFIVLRLAAYPIDALLNRLTSSPAARDRESGPGDAAPPSRT